MIFKGFFISNKKVNGLGKIIRRIKSVDNSSYEYYKCKPRFFIRFRENYKKFKRDDNVVYVQADNLNMEKMNLLGFGLEGLITNEEKIKKYEQFGRYRCIIDIVDEDIPDKYIDVKDI